MKLRTIFGCAALTGLLAASTANGQYYGYPHGYGYGYEPYLWADGTGVEDYGPWEPYFPYEESEDAQEEGRSDIERNPDQRSADDGWREISTWADEPKAFASGGYPLHFNSADGDVWSDQDRGDVASAREN